MQQRPSAFPGSHFILRLADSAQKVSHLLTSLASKLIDVTQPLSSEEGRPVPPKLGGDVDYSRLFAEQFGDLTIRNPAVEEGKEDGSELDIKVMEQEEVRNFRRLLAKEAEALSTWKTPQNLGSLILTFQDLMDSGKGKMAAT